MQFDEHYVGLSGRRMVLHDLHAFAQFRKDIVDSVGVEPARRMFTRFGTFWGEADAAAMKRLFRWENLEELIRAGPRMHSLQGVVRPVVRELELDRAMGRFEMKVTWYDSGEAEEHLLELGQADHPVCWMLVGYASGYATYCLGQRIYFVEQQCRGKGDRVCSVIGRDEASWGDALGPHRAFFEADKIMEKVNRLSLEIQRRQRALERAEERLGRAPTLGSWLEVRSNSFRRVLDLAERVAPYESSILISGESGTGKEVLARFIHSRSKHASDEFLGVNCASLPDSLLESELFGHKAGAFTGAIHDRVGLFEAAGQGTVFLDEIGEISPTMQAKLLRVLQEREVVRLGENRPRKIRARILAATNRKLADEVHTGRFREDLYYRIRVVELEVPPLRERREDILPLARHFVSRHAERLGLPELKLDASALNALLDYPWPGNVRELENALERASVLSRDGRITRRCLPPEVIESDRQHSPVPEPNQSLEQVEREHIQRVLKATGNNRSEAARILGIGQTTLWRKLKVEEAGTPRRVGPRSG
ncbi:MAG: sigma-54-dependent Fis family transcriptional regulator [Polyangiaceae bacterium]|nr:sigma-54-dependent Fis family transcriptional regulator [Polyangiaceae bacterium]